MFRAQNMARKMKNVRGCIVSPRMIHYARVEVAARMDAIKHGLKAAQETFSLRHTGDVITNDPLQSRNYDDDGIFYMGLLDFLTNPKALESF